MKNIDDMPPKCHDCPYWEIAKKPYNCKDCENTLKHTLTHKTEIT